MRRTRIRRSALCGALAIGVAALPLIVMPAANAAPAVTVAINEVETQGTKTAPDWIELANFGTETVDVSGWVLGDDSAKRVTIANGTVIAAGGFLAVPVDIDGGFGLGKEDQARLFLPDGTTLVDSYGWSAHGSTHGRCIDGTGDWGTGLTPTPGAANDCGAVPPVDPPVDPDVLPAVFVNEVESNGGVPGDWIELYNAETTAVDVSGWVLHDDSSKSVTLQAGTSIAAGGFLAVDVAAGFGLGAADQARLFLADGTTLVDSYQWTSHAKVTYGRCPDGGTEWRDTTVATKGAANDCSTGAGTETPSAAAWPGAGGMTAIDSANTFGEDMSGVVYESADTVWAVNNGTGTLHKLALQGGTGDTPVSLSETQRWPLRFPGGSGIVDSEAIALIGGSAANGVLVGAERDNSNKNVSRPSVLRYAVAGTGALAATNEWSLQSYYPGIGANAGIEGIAWVSDEALVAAGLVDRNTQAPYAPAGYPAHSGGLVFVGVEATNIVSGYLLGDAGEIVKIAEFETAFPGIMELEYDSATVQLWALCDEVCEGRAQLFAVNADGVFAATALYERPSSTQNYANEGFAIAPISACTDGQRQVLWADDAQADGHAFRSGSIDCTAQGGGSGDGGSGDGGSGSGGDGLPSTGGTPSAPAESALTQQLNNQIGAPASVPVGASFDITVSGSLNGQTVHVWIYSTPTYLGAHAVSGGKVTVKLPASVAAGTHRIVVTDANGTVIGWRSISVTADGLPDTGANADTLGSAAALAAIALLSGAGLLLVSRRRAV